MEAFELRLWDGRLGRWLTVDPMGQYFSPYLGMGNNPISRIDPDGGADGDPPLFTTAAAGYKPVRVYGPQLDGADMGYDLPMVAVEGRRSLSFLQDLAKDNWLKDLRNFTSVWADENIRQPIVSELDPIREEFSKARKDNHDILHEKLGPLYELQAKIGGGAASSLLIGRSMLTRVAAEATVEAGGVTLAVVGAGPDVSLASGYIASYRNLAPGYTDFVMHGSEFRKLNFYQFNRLLTKKGVTGNVRLWVCRAGENRRAMELLAKKRGVRIQFSEAEILVGKGYYKFLDGSTMFDLVTP
ncbi:hypothetical protein NAT51_19260 [Flavobacterium amniphilum]|uniref:hypothetical protein n=1 Tax=Flavobacterium amniphilum TaxID=1834035 RepID=UPI002029EF25|nr:hypothetical protein [Flavobacterium amniphilum]MCL9807670.1 hypothetical protein [Flavobacterium amniphilum]